MWAPPRWVIETPVLKRLVPSLLRRYAQAAKLPFVIERRMGALFVLEQGNLVDRSLLTRGAWEAAQVAQLRRLTAAAVSAAPGQPRVFLDIGAHGGLYAILFSQDPGFDAVHAFEPEAENFAQLQANLLINGLIGKVRAHEVAVSNAKGSIEIGSAARRNRGAAAVVRAEHERSARGQRTVAAEKLDDLIGVEKTLIVAKIDVEGYELEVVDGMRQLLSRNAAVLQVECFEANRAGLRARLAALGFQQATQINDDLYFTRSLEHDRF